MGVDEATLHIVVVVVALFLLYRLLEYFNDIARTLLKITVVLLVVALAVPTLPVTRDTDAARWLVSLGEDLLRRAEAATTDPVAPAATWSASLQHWWSS